MHILGLQRRRVILAAMVFLICRVLVVASDEPTLSKEEIKEFLLTAKVVRSQLSKKGITNPWRLRLTDGTTTHDASFQSVDEHRTLARISREAGKGRKLTRHSVVLRTDGCPCRKRIENVTNSSTQKQGANKSAA